MAFQMGMKREEGQRWGRREGVGSQGSITVSTSHFLRIIITYRNSRETGRKIKDPLFGFSKMLVRVFFFVLLCFYLLKKKNLFSTR